MSLAHTGDIPLPELDTEEESRYLRRQKAVAVRGSRIPKRTRSALKWVLFGVLVLLPIGYGGYGLAAFVLSSPRFMLTLPDDVEAQGNQYVSREEIISTLGMQFPASGRGVHLLLLPLEEKKKQIEAIPWVRAATLTRSYPHHLVVQVVERTPVAIVNAGGGLKLVDEEGVLLDVPERAVFDFPVLTGLDNAGSLSDRRSRLALYLEFNRTLGDEIPRSGWLVTEADLSDADDLKALLVQGRETIQVHFGHGDFLERFHNFHTFLPEALKTNSGIDSVDLRYKNQIVVSPKATEQEGSGSAESGAGNRE